MIRIDACELVIKLQLIIENYHSPLIDYYYLWFFGVFLK